MNRITQLIDKYFQGETTLEEEKELRQFFLQKDVPMQFQKYRPLFALLEKERASGLNNDFDEQFFQKMQTTPKKPRIRSLSYRWIGAVAASAILALSLWWLYPQVETNATDSAINWEQYEPDDPKEAFRITKSALLRVSIELNIGAEKAAREVRSVKDFLKE